MMGILYKILMESWHMLQDSALFMLFGFTVAGVIKGLAPDDWVFRHLGNGNSLAVLKASLLGIPLPLCSCGVVPAAAGLHRQGAGKGATVAFLISTPETGVDSMAITYALLDPLMTVIRPVAAFITATVAGLGVNWTERNRNKVIVPQTIPTEGCTCSGCGCAENAKPRSASLLRRVYSGISYSFGDLLQDIGKWFLLGLVIAGVISAYLSPEFMERYMGGGMIPMLIMLIVAVPFYVCATASTPIAAALAMKGLSPGAALVFLLAGPATNAASLMVVIRILGGKAAAIYLVAIAGVSLLLGLGTDVLYEYLGIDAVQWSQGGQTESMAWISTMGAILLLLLIAKSCWPRKASGGSALDVTTACGCRK